MKWSRSCQGKKRWRRILRSRQTCCISLAEVAVIIFPDQIIILKIIDKSYIKCFSEPAFRLVCFIVKQQSGSFRKLQQDHGGRGMTASGAPQNTDFIHRIAAAPGKMDSSFSAIATVRPKPKLLDQLREALRSRQYSRRVRLICWKAVTIFGRFRGCRVIET